VKSIKLTSRERRFLRFSSVEYDGQLYMTPQDFLESVVEAEPKRKTMPILLIIIIILHSLLNSLLTIYPNTDFLFLFSSSAEKENTVKRRFGRNS